MDATSPSLALPPDAPIAAGRLSGLVVGQLGPGEQFVLWALRQRLGDEVGAASPSLLRGFRLAFGLAEIEAALAAFEGLFRALLHGARPGEVDVLPLRSACVSAGERAVLRLVVAAQAGERFLLEALADRLAEETAATGHLRDAAGSFARVLRRAELSLAPLPDAPVPPPSSALH